MLKNKINYRFAIPEIIAVIFIAIHGTAMVLYPLAKYSPSWTLIHQTWMDWQTYNAAFIALIASFIAYKATVYNYSKERENNLFASKALLPHALNTFCNYTSACARTNRAVKALATNGHSSGHLFLQNPNAIPVLDRDALAVFTDCIKYADRNLGKYLAKILEEIQVVTARLERLRDRDLTHYSTTGITDEHLDHIAHVRFRVESLFPFARNEEDFKEIEPTPNDISNIINTRLYR